MKPKRYSISRNSRNLSRKEFISSCAICTAGMAIFPTSVFSSSDSSQKKLKGDDWEIIINEKGHIVNYFSMHEGKKEIIPFRKDEYAGPTFKDVQLMLKDENLLLFSGEKKDIKYTLQYKNISNTLSIEASIENRGSKPHAPKYERMILGLDTYMEKYPGWNSKFFPTMLRCEKTHFFGYAMSPLGRILAFASPDPLASWNNEYLVRRTINDKKNASVNSHRIFTAGLDLLHCLPLPERHPQNLNRLMPGEKTSFTLYLKELNSLDELNKFYGETTKAPIVELDHYTVATNKKISGSIYSKFEPDVKVYAPQNHQKVLTPVRVKKDLYSFSFSTDRGIGHYRIVLNDENGNTTEATAYCRNDWSWYLNQARQEALECKPTSTHHAECFYPFYTYYLARKHLPNQRIDEECEEIFQELFYELFDPEVKEMRNGKHRIQDTATMVGILTDRYQVSGDIEDMENAAGLVDFLIKNQKEDGGFYNPQGQTHYTSVIYIAKSIMEYLTSVRKLAKANPKWKDIYNRHYESVGKALDDLTARVDNIETEGMGTFEDGMISCSATQLALGALREPNTHKGRKYKEVSLTLTDKHQCLTLLKVPDSRMYGATLRFWEAQYTVNLMHGLLNSPCGWSAWKTYGIWYQYLLTGNEDYLRLVVNSLGTFMQLIDHETGKLKFCFTPDPYIEAGQFLETPMGSGKPELQPVVIGEQYIDMMSYWHRYPHTTWREKWGIDNFIHEIIKCMEEIILTNAYVIESKEGVFVGYNCEVKKVRNKLFVHANEEFISNLHVNLKNQYDIEFQTDKTRDYNKISGMRWVTGIPDDIKVLSRMS